LKSLQKLVLCLCTGLHTINFPPFGGFIHELEKFSNQNVLEVLDLEIHLSHSTDLTVTLEECQELDDVLANGYHHLRHFTLEYVKVVYYEDPVFEAAAKIDKDLEAMFSEGFSWCSKHIDKFVTHGEGYVL
jgi:hypothetical protein